MSRKPFRSNLAKSRRDTILIFLYEFMRDNDYYPTIRQIGESAEIPSTSVTNYYLDQLEKQNFITRIKKISRGIVLTRAGRRQAMLLSGVGDDIPETCPHCGKPLSAAPAKVQKRKRSAVGSYPITG